MYWTFLFFLVGTFLFVCPTIVPNSPFHLSSRSSSKVFHGYLINLSLVWFPFTFAAGIYDYIPLACCLISVFSILFNANSFPFCQFCYFPQLFCFSPSRPINLFPYLPLVLCLSNCSWNFTYWDEKESAFSCSFRSLITISRGAFTSAHPQTCTINIYYLFFRCITLWRYINVINFLQQSKWELRTSGFMFLGPVLLPLFCNASVWKHVKYKFKYKTNV